FCVVGCAASGDEAISALCQLDVDVALLDIRMPGMTGLEVASRLHKMQRACRVIVLTTFDERGYVEAAIRSGAVGFLLKDAPTEALFDAIRAAHAGHVLYASVHAGPAWIATQTAADAPASSDSSAHDMTIGAGGVEAPAGPLTSRECEVLRLMAQGMSNQEIASALYLSLGTVKTHVHRILQKVAVTDRTQAVVWALRGGLCDGSGGPDA
ncbi:MAG: response regulator transcription factor, partial [Firmicutes bacterium]|nr:response regulator transcription factor [Bacillota bacterium]